MLATTASAGMACIPISDGSGEDGMLSVQGFAWDEGELLMVSTSLTWWKCL